MKLPPTVSSDAEQDSVLFTRELLDALKPVESNVQDALRRLWEKYPNAQIGEGSAHLETEFGAVEMSFKDLTPPR